VPTNKFSEKTSRCHGQLSPQRRQVGAITNKLRAGVGVSGVGMEPISRTARKVWYSFPMKKRTRRKYAPELLRKTVNNKLAVYFVFLLCLIILLKNVILSKILHFRASSVYFEKKITFM